MWKMEWLWVVSLVCLPACTVSVNKAPKSCRIVFEIVSLIYWKLKGHVTVTTPLSGTICRP